MAAGASSEEVEMFMTVTGAPREAAVRHLQQSRGDMDAAVARFFEEGGPIDEPPTETLPAAPSSDNASDPVGSIEGILGSAKDNSKSSSGAGQGAPDDPGKGSGKGKGKGNVRTIGIVFLGDGFMVDEDFKDEPEEQAQPTPEEAKPHVRRTGMMSLNDFKTSSRAPRGPMPKIPTLKPLRQYDTPENKAFLDQINSGKLPRELQKRDEKGEPIQVSIAVSDLRPRTYAELEKVIEQMKKMKDDGEKEQEPEKPKTQLFAGAGQTLSGGTSAAGATGSSGLGTSSGAGADPGLVALVSGGVAPSVDESKPVTTIQLRLASGRVKTRLNLDHTVADLWRVVAAEMGLEAFKAASQHELKAGFPPKVLADPSISLEAADLKNAAVNHTCR